jgi:DNA-directed RNA polymerase I, II, and III subunit RPABC3
MRLSPSPLPPVAPQRAPSPLQSFPTIAKRETLMDEFEYVMYGLVYKYKPDTGAGAVRVEVYASFGGLLMKVKGDPAKLAVLEVDSNLYLLMRKV